VRLAGSLPVGEVAAAVLVDLGVTSVRLLDVEPGVRRCLRDRGLELPPTVPARVLAG
jgi:hypothetical protein